MLLDRVKKTIDDYHLLDQGDRLIVGVSAGVDSMVLLHLLYILRQEFALSLIVGHVNHGFRPKESEKEAELVQKESERLGLRYEYGHFNVKEFQKIGGFSPQDAGRKIRFHFLESLMKKHGANKIALGHNADDQIETVFLRLIRGSGLKGLKGMLPIRGGKIIRPLLEVWREEIEAFAREKEIPYLVDSSNLSGRYLRNRIRLNLFPLIEKEVQANFKEIVLKTSTMLRAENEYLEKGVEEAYRKIVKEGEDGLSFDFMQYQCLDEAIQWRVIRKMLEWVYDGERVIEGTEEPNIGPIFRKLQQSSPSFLLALPSGVFFEKKYDVVFLRRGRVEAIPPFEVELILPGRTWVKEIGKEVLVEQIGRKDLPRDLNGAANTAFLDYHDLRFPLKIRNFRPGDRFHPMGAGGTQKLKEFFIDHKVPRFERPEVPLIISGEMIAWVVGYRIDERLKITEKTQEVLKIMIM